MAGWAVHDAEAARDDQEHAREPDSGREFPDQENPEDDADDASEKSVTSSKPVAMNKRELKKVILKFGGNVLDEFPGPKQKIPDGVLVVSDRLVQPTI